MANEKKDGMFDLSLGDGLIDIPEKTEKTETGKKVETTEDTEKTDKEKEKKEVGFTQYEDGMIEIDEFLQKTIDAQATEKKDGTDIDKTEETEDKGSTPSDGDSSSDSSPSSSPYLAFAKDRANEGVFLNFSDDDWKVLMERNEGNEAAALRELSNLSMREMIKTGVEQYKDSLTEEERALYEAKEKGIPVDVYGVAKHNLEKYSNIKSDDLKENEKLQIELVSKALELRGFTADEVAEEIEGYKALENLEAKAEKALTGLPKVYKKQITDLEESATADEQSRKDQIRQRVSKMKQMVDQTLEIVPGIKLTKPTRDKVMKSMMEPITTDENGQPLNPVMATRAKNPDAFEMMVHYYHQLGLFNIDENGAMKPDFSKISKTAKTEATDDMRKIFESKEKTVTGKTKTIKTKDDDLDEFDEAFGRL